MRRWPRPTSCGRADTFAPDAPAVFHTRSGRLSADAPRRLDRDGLSGRAGRAGPRAGRAGRGARGRARPLRPEPVRLVSSRSTPSCAEATVRGLAPDNVGALGRLPVRGVIVTARGATEARRSSTSCRASSPLAPASTRIVPGHRLRALLPRPLLAPPARPRRVHGLAGLGARWRGQGGGGGRSCPAVGAGGHRAARGSAGQVKAAAPERLGVSRGRARRRHRPGA